MGIYQRSKAWRKLLSAKACCALAFVLTSGATASFAAPTFYSTSTDPLDISGKLTHWEVATNVGGTDGAYASFPTTGAGFFAAIPRSGGSGWVANTSSGNNGCGTAGCTWVFFVFRQTFDLTGYDPATADLKFQWAADDSGQGYAARGNWRPQYALNSMAEADLKYGWGPGADTYSFGPILEINSGFHPGLNTMYFFVEGNAQTDGFQLNTVSFTANPVPEPETYAMLLAGLGLLGFATRRKKHLAA